MTYAYVADSSNVNPHALREVLYETRELRQQQDAKLQRWRRVVAGTFALFVAASSIAISASGQLKPLTAAGTLMGVAFFLLLTAIGFEAISSNWIDGPDEWFLKKVLENSSTSQDVDLALIKKHQEIYEDNERILRRVMWAALVHIITAVIIASVIIRGLLAAVPDAFEQDDAPASEPIESVPQSGP
ncbi:MAG: hypothetical protein F4223_03300 [Rhodobacteraceae bacterium]|nr:hypothetical protein [Paracoccaceae bacterium]